MKGVNPIKIVAQNKASDEKWENLVNPDGGFAVVVDAMQGDDVKYTFTDSARGCASVTLPIPIIIQSSLLEGPPKTVDIRGETPGGPQALLAMRQQQAAAGTGQPGDGTAPSGLRGLKKIVAVARFYNKANVPAMVNLGDAMGDQLVNALKQSDKFVVREQELLSDVFGEQDLSQSGRMAESKTAQIGKAISAQYLVRGTVSEYDMLEASGQEGFSLYGSGKSKARSRAHMAVIIDLIDTSSGTVVASQRMVGKAESRAKSSDVSFAGISAAASSVAAHAGAFVPPVIGGYSSGSQKHDPHTKAMQMCINNAVYFISTELEKIPWKSRVVKVSPDGITIRGGEHEGIKPGFEFAVYREKEQTRDPETGEILDTESEKIARIHVEKAKDEVSLARNLEGGEIKVGDMVRMQ
ncbi:MAG: hypothetical protein NTZ78_11320 [Candidatus Aureabacteria bacterium]|nr:hypothetical protein [Candidatus Auribacterota bacterium]